MEIWKEIKGYYYRYRVSDMGRVQRLYKDGWRDMNPTRCKTGKKKQRGSIYVRFTVVPKKYEVNYVAHLVAKYFLGPKPKGTVIAHKDSTVTNCEASNLYYTTREQLGQRYGGCGRKAVEKIDEHGNVLELYGSVSEASRKTHVCRRAVIMHCSGKLKEPFRLLPFTFRYEVTK